MESSLPLVAGTAGAFRQTLQRHPMLGPLAMAAGIVVSRRWMVLLAEEMEKGQDEGDSKDTTKKEGSQSQAEDKPLSAAMVGKQIRYNVKCGVIHSVVRQQLTDRIHNNI
jgi:hypothetical protein